MSKQIFSFLFLFSLSIQSQNPVVQNSPPPKSNEEDQCARYSMQVISPSDAIDYKLRIIKPMEGIDYKLIVINPCETPKIEIAEVVPSKSDPVTNTITPSLRFKHPSARELKTPSEMLKEFALPKNPKKEQR